MRLDLLAHAALAYGFALSLHVLRVPTWLTVAATSGAAVAWEARQTESVTEHQQDLVAGFGGMLLAEALWQNSREGTARRLLSDAYEAGAVDVADKAVYHAAYRDAAACLGVARPYPAGVRILAGPVPQSWKVGVDARLTFRGYASPKARAVIVADSLNAPMVAHELFHVSVGAGHGWYRPGCPVPPP